MGRSNVAIAIAGRKNTGKSTWLEERARKMKANTGKKVLIIDVNASPAYSHYQLLSYNGLESWCKNHDTGIKRFFDSDYDKMFSVIPKHFKNGGLILEDCTKYIPAIPSPEIKTYLVDHRMWNVDLFFTFHALEFIPKFFFKMITHYTVFKTQDILDNRDRELRKRFPNYDVLKKAWDDVMKSSNEHANRTVPTLM